MRLAVVHLILVLPILLMGQTNDVVVWRSHFFLDSNQLNQEYFNPNFHPIYPMKVTTADWVKSLPEKQTIQTFSLKPVNDIVFGAGEDDSQFRTGLGFILDYLPTERIHLKAAYSGGISSDDAQNYKGGVYPFSVIRKRRPDSLWNYHDVRIRATFNLNSHFDVQLGIDQNQIGFGDRSLLLSDFGTPYPFIQGNMKFWRFHYQVMQTYFQNPSGNGHSTRPKFGAFHYLSMNITEKLNLGLFETVIYDGLVGDQRRGFEPTYLTPFVLHRPTEFKIGSTDQVLMGLNLACKLNSKFILYGQGMIDEFKINKIRSRNRDITNKFGAQLGAKGFVNTSLGQLNYLSEFNVVRPFSYSHSNPGQSYTNFGNPLAHPLGANFVEHLSRVILFRKRWDFSIDVLYFMQGKDLEDGVHWGSDINQSLLITPVDDQGDDITEGFFIGSGERIQVMKLQYGAGFLVIPRFKMRVFLNLESMWLAKEGELNFSQGVFIGLRSELWNDRRNY